MELTKERKKELNQELRSLDKWARKKLCGEEDSKIIWLWFGIISTIISIVIFVVILSFAVSLI